MQNWLVFRVGIQIDLTSVLGSKLPCFFVGDKKWLGFSVRTEIDVFLCGGQNWPCFCVWVENHLFFVWAWNWLGFGDGRNGLDPSVGNRTWIDFSAGMKLIWLCGGWKLTCYLYAGRKSLIFNIMKIDFCVGGPNWLDSSVGWNGFRCCVGCRKWLHFGLVHRHWFGFA